MLKLEMILKRKKLVERLEFIDEEKREAKYPEAARGIMLSALLYQCIQSSPSSSQSLFYPKNNLNASKVR